MGLKKGTLPPCGIVNRCVLMPTFFVRCRYQSSPHGQSTSTPKLDFDLKERACRCRQASLEVFSDVNSH